MFGLRSNKMQPAQRSRMAGGNGIDGAEHLHRRDLIARDMHLRAETIDTDNRSVEAIIATENRATVLDLGRWEVIDEILLMDGVRLPSSGQIPMLENHLRYTLQTHLGSIRELRVENLPNLGPALIGRLFFAQGDSVPEAERAWQLVRQGHLTDVSTGNQALTATTIEAGETSTVNGRSFTAGPKRPLQITTTWRPREGSLTSIGADADAKVRSDGANQRKQESSMKTLPEALDDLIHEQESAMRSRQEIIDDMAHAAGVETASVQRMLDGVEMPNVSREHLRAFADVLDAPMEMLKDAAEEDGVTLVS